MFVCLLSCAVQKHAPLKKVFPTKKTPKLLKETYFNNDYTTLLAQRQLPYKKYCQIASADNWSAFSRSPLKLANVMKDEHESFSGKCFSSLSSAKDRWKINNSVRGSNLHPSNLTVVRNSLGEVIVDSKKISPNFKYVFSNLGYYIGKMIEEAPLSTAGNGSFCFWAI